MKEVTPDRKVNHEHREIAPEKESGSAPTTLVCLPGTNSSDNKAILAKVDQNSSPEEQAASFVNLIVDQLGIANPNSTAERQLSALLDKHDTGNVLHDVERSYPFDSPNADQKSFIKSQNKQTLFRMLSNMDISQDEAGNTTINVESQDRVDPLLLLLDSIGVRAGVVGNDDDGIRILVDSSGQAGFSIQDGGPALGSVPEDIREGEIEGLGYFGDPVSLPPGAKIKVAVECGSTTVKTVVLDEDDNILHGTYQKHHSKVFEKSAELMEKVLERFKDQEVINIGFSGSAGQKVAAKLSYLVDVELENKYGVDRKKGQPNIKYTSEVVSQTYPVLAMYGDNELTPDPPTPKDPIHIFEIGGEDSKFVQMTADGQMTRVELNGECAAGTGTFLEEQVPRVGYDDLGSMIDGAGEVSDQTPPCIAGRCTVFAKSDITHLLRKENVAKELVAWGLHSTVAGTFLVNLIGELKRGLPGSGPIIFQGGTSKNRTLVQAFRRLLEQHGIDPKRLVVPEFPEIRIAQGAAMAAAELVSDDKAIDADSLHAGIVALKDFIAHREVRAARDPLKLRDPKRLEKTWKPYEFKKGEKRDVLLGLDVGSTTTKFVLLDAETEAVLYRSYVRTRGEPFEVMEEGLRKIRDELEENINILHVGITGSGREAMGAMVGADIVVDEINAHATGVGRLHSDADTIFEIGGQDAKFMRVMNGVVTDFEMNKACAAGTGSFFDEAASRILDVAVEDLGDMALNSMTPPDLGEVCTVFMKSRIVQAQADGYSPDDIAAGLAYSIAKNYLNKVKGSKPIGDKIVFQGGVANNKAVVAAMEAITGKDIVVPEQSEVMGAIGAALIAKTRYDRIQLDAEQTAFENEVKPESAPPSRFRGLSANMVPEEIGKG
ncbi:acyl-CoA dehydratase activase, partial [Myxococcota bacterium]